MREGISLTTIFRAIIIFTFLFTIFIALAISYNKAYKIKNETLSIIEKYEGITDKSLQIINNYLDKSGYNIKNSCQDGEFGVASLDSVILDEVSASSANRNYYYCLSETLEGNKIHYNIRIFYKFNLPYIGDLLTFSINGETKDIKYYDEMQRLK